LNPRYFALLLIAGAALLIPAGAHAATKSVVAGPPVAKPPRDFPKDADTNAFYRKTVTVRVGDKVRWTIRGLHTITFAAKGKQFPPFISPDPARPIAGANDAAGAPFWFNGLPRLILDPQGAFPVGGKTYDGSKAASSGIPLPGSKPKPYTLKFTKAGSYGYVCTVHPGMKGRVKVVAKRKRIPSAAADKLAVKKEWATVVADAKKLGASAGPTGNEILAGNDKGTTVLFRFFPLRKTVPVGTTLTLKMSPKTSEAHTFSFGPAPYLQQQADALIGPDTAVPPVLTVNPVAAFPSDPPPTLGGPTGANHGNGYVNTGLLDDDSATPSPISTQVRFDTAGTYDYICILHPFMKGQIVVG
jgi:plastocyanin